MGVCITKPGSIFNSTGGVPTESNPPGDSNITSLTTEVKQPVLVDYTQQKISENVPSTFYPETSLTTEEKQCQNVIQSMELQLSSGQSIQSLLDSWEEDGFLSIINGHVLSQSIASKTSIGDLAYNLTADSSKYVKELRGNKFLIEVAKAYALFLWITKNFECDNNIIEASKSSNRVKIIPESYLIIEKCRGTAFDSASLFTTLCAAAALNAEIIDGHRRNWRSITGAEFQPDEHNFHSWNVVKIRNVPILIDCMLGSGYINSSLEFVKAHTRHYFAVPPQNLILTHWPLHQSKQFLKSPLSLQTLKPIIPVSMKTLSLGIHPLNWSEIINVGEKCLDPVTSVSVIVSDITNLYLSAKLVPLSQAESEEHNEDELQRHIFIRQVNENKFNIQAVLSRSGTFVLNVYLFSKTEHDRPKDFCLSYIIKSEMQQKDEVGYPYVFSLPAEAFNFKPLYWNNNKKSHDCVHSDEVFSLVFEASSDMSFYHCLIRGKVASTSVSNNDIHHHHNTLIVGNSNHLYKLLSVFPEKGWWTLFISGTRVSGDEKIISGYTSLLNYHVFVENGSQKLSYPKITMPGAVLFDVNPVIPAETGDLLTTIPFALSKHLEFSHYLTLEHMNEELWEGYSNIEVADQYDNGNYKHYKLNIIFPKRGTWFVHVFGLNSDEESHKKVFELKIKTEAPRLNTLLVQSNALSQSNCGIKLINGGIVTFLDDGQPFTFKFVAPDLDISFIHELKSHDDSLDDSYCTFLTPHVKDCAQNETTYSLSALFPTAGKWSICLFAAKVGEENVLVLQVRLNVKKPVLDYCYPKIYPGFSDFDCKVLEKDALLKSCSETNELKLPFQASSRVYFFCEVKNLTAENTKDLLQQAFVHSNPDTSAKILHVIFPEPGQWKLNLFAKSMDVSTENDLTPVLQIFMRSTACKRDFSFPILNEGFYKLHKLHFDPSNLPLPSLIKVDKIPRNLVIGFYSPPGVTFKHRAEVKIQDEDNNFDGTTEHVLTRMMSSSDTGLHELIVEVAKPGQWTVSLYAQNTENLLFEGVMEYSFYTTI